MRAAVPLLAAALAVAVPSASRAAACPRTTPEVTVSTPDVSVDVQDVRSVVDYTAFPWQTQNTMAPGWVINGLTVARPRSSYQVEALQGPGCYALTKVALTLAFDDPVKVYIADKYRPGSCQHETIYAHEMQHVDIFRRGRLIYAERFREIVGAAARGAAASDPASAQEAISAAVDTVMREFSSALGAAHGAIDTVENYRLTQARCPSW